MAKNKQFVPNDNNLAIAYYRYSSHSQNETSIDQQREAAHKYADAHGLTIIKEYEDSAISGTTDERPAFQLMLSEVAKLKPAALIMWKTDRLGRDRYILVAAKKTIRDAGCRIHLVAEAIPETDTPEGLLLEGLLDSMAAFYSDQLRTNIKRGIQHNAKHGLYNGHKVYGYTVDAATKRYVIDPEKAAVVRRVFEDYANGRAMQDIADELNAQGQRTARGVPFTVNSLRSILKSDRYIGVYREAGVVIEDGMPVIIPKELFDKAQARFAANKRNGSQRARGLTDDDAPRYWLTGKLYCGECGSPMHGAYGTSKTGARHYYYVCNVASKPAHACKKKAVRKDTIEGLVVMALRDLLCDSGNLASLAVDAAAYYKERYEDTAYLDGLKRELSETEKAIRNLIRALEAGIFSDSTQARLTELEQRKASLAEAIEVETVKGKLVEDEHSIKAYFEQYANADFENPATREMLLEYFIDKIYVYDDRLVITGFYSGDTREVTWEELSDGSVEFDCFALSSTMDA